MCGFGFISSATIWNSVQIEKLVEDVARKVSSPLPKANFDKLSYAAYQEMEGESEDFKNDILSYIKFKKSQKGND